MVQARFCHRWNLLFAGGLIASILGAGCMPPLTATPTLLPSPTYTVTTVPTTATTASAPTITPSPTSQPTVTPQPTATLLPTATVNPAWLQGRTIFYTVEDENAERPWVEIWRINADGSEKQRLARHELSDEEAQYNPMRGSLCYWLVSDLALAPDKKTVAYALGIKRRGNFAAGQPALWLVNTDGTQHRRIFYLPDPIDTIGKEIARVYWSPDGQYLAFYFVGHQHRGAGGEIYLLDVNEEALECIEQIGRDVAWLPHSQRVSYLRGEWEEKEQEYRFNFCILDLSQQPRQPICFPVESFTIGSGYDWSPDGKWLAFSQDDGVYIRSAANTAKPQLLAKDDHVKSGVRWSPDGRMIAYFTLLTQPQRSWTWKVISVQDGHVLVGVKDIVGETWSSDSQALIGSGVASDGNIYVVFVPGGQVWKVPNVERASLTTW